MLENIWDGLLLGAVYLACGRNLAAAIVAHGVTDTVDLLLMYWGKVSGDEGSLDGISQSVREMAITLISSILRFPP